MKPPDDARFRLRLPRIEPKPKRVRLEGWKDHAGIGKDPVLRAEIDDIVESIGRGDGVPEQHYRAGIDRDSDELLRERGIMHLHLGGKHSDTLGILVQAWFVNLERDMAEAEQVARQATTGTERQAAEERRARLAASLARLKEEAGKV